MHRVHFDERDGRHQTTFREKKHKQMSVPKTGEPHKPHLVKKEASLPVPRYPSMDAKGNT